MGMIIDDIAFHRVSKLDVGEIAQSIKGRFALVCPAETSALEAISIATESNIPLIVVTTDPLTPPHRDTTFESFAIPDLGNRVVCGIVEPQRLRNALSIHFTPVTGLILDAARKYENDPGEAQRRWRHEWHNLDEPVLQYCPQDGGHVTTLPCRYHSASASTIW